MNGFNYIYISTDNDGAAARVLTKIKRRLFKDTTTYTVDGSEIGVCLNDRQVLVDEFLQS